MRRNTQVFQISRVKILEICLKTIFFAVQINEESIRKLRIGIHWDPLKYAENSESDDNSSFTEFFVTNSHSLSDTVNNSEEDGLSDIVDTPEAALVIKPVKTLDSNQSSNSEVEQKFDKNFDNFAVNSMKTSPKKGLKRSNHPNNKKPIIDRSMISSLQRYFLTRKQERKLFHHPNGHETPSLNNNGTSIKLNNMATKNMLAEFKKQNILIVSLYLPIKVKALSSKNTDDHSRWEVTIETRDFASNLLNCLLISKTRFYFLGILQTTDPVPFDKQEELRSFLKEKYHCIAILHDFSDLHKIKQEFFLNYFDYCLNFNLPRNSSKLFNYDEQLYLHYYKGQLLRVFNNEIQNICHFHPNPLLSIIDYQLFGLPNLLKANGNNETMSIIFYWGLSFLNDDNFTSLPFGTELLMSILCCNCLVFNTYQEAKPFFAILKEKTGLDFMSNNGLLFINHMARSIAIRFASGLLDCEILKRNSLANSERLWETYWKDVFEGYDLIVSIDDSDRNLSLLILKLKLIEALAYQILSASQQENDIFIENNGKKMRFIETDDFTENNNKKTKCLENENFAQNNYKKIKFLEIYTSNPSNQLPLIQAKNLAKEINDRLGYECIFIIEDVIPENIENSLLSHTKFLLETQIYETSICKIQRFLYLTKNLGIVLIPSSFESWISSQTLNFLGFHHLSPNEFANKVHTFIKSVNSSDFYIKPAKDSFSEASNPIIWLEEAFDDMIVSSNFTPNNDLFLSIPPKNSYFEPIRLPSRHISIPNLTKTCAKRKNKLIVLGYEDVIISKDVFTFIKDDFDQSVKKILKKPSDGLLEALQKLSQNPNVTIYVVTGRGLDLLGSWFMDLENIGFAHEYGFLNKDPGSRVWHRLFEMDWNWKDIVKKIMENYAIKTPGSSLEIKESCVIWKYERSDYDLGLKQAEALIGHLNEVFENNSEIDVIKYERAVEVRPMGLNKGSLVQIICEKLGKEKGKIDFVATVGGILSDEDIFNGINEALKINANYFVNLFSFLAFLPFFHFYSSKF